MNQPFNKLTDSEAERLAILAEECAEVIKCVGKILRHGYESFDPTGKEQGTNREQLEVEIGHVEAISKFMETFKDVDYSHIELSAMVKWHKLEDGRQAYLHHQ